MRKSHGVFGWKDQAWFVTGPTGAGKTFLSHLFAMNPLYAKYDDDNGEFVINPVDAHDNRAIGHNIVKSETRIPNNFFREPVADSEDSQKQTIPSAFFWDLQGFGDTEGPVIEIAG